MPEEPGQAPPHPTATLHVRLRGFVEPDTSSQQEGFLDPGRYPVLEYKEGYPDERSDYALLLAPALGAGDTWVCTRWKGRRYADVVKEPAPPTERRLFDDDPDAVPESALVDLLPRFHEFTYDEDKAYYPFELPGVQVPRAPPTSNNCCTFVEALLVRAWADTHDDFNWSIEQHRQMMIYSGDDYFSPVTAAVDAGMAVAPDSDEAPHPWTLVQGWRHRWRGGHAFIVVDHHPDTDRVLTLESNSAYRLDGPGFRMIGNLRDVPDPPEAWWTDEDLWTWERIRATYRYRGAARLKVAARSWSRN
jgi:hypothetical protein